MVAKADTSDRESQGLLMGKGASLRSSGIAFLECVGAVVVVVGGGAKTGLHLPGGQTWEALRALYPEPT